MAESVTISPEDRIGHLIRGTHPYCYKSGEWGLVLGLDVIYDRLCWSVSWPDGSVDDFVVSDTDAGYEFRSADG